MRFPALLLGLASCCWSDCFRDPRPGQDFAICRDSSNGFVMRRDFVGLRLCEYGQLRPVGLEVKRTQRDRRTIQLTTTDTVRFLTDSVLRQDGTPLAPMAGWLDCPKMPLDDEDPKQVRTEGISKGAAFGLAEGSRAAAGLLGFILGDGIGGSNRKGLAVAGAMSTFAPVAVWAVSGRPAPAAGSLIGSSVGLTAGYAIISSNLGSGGCDGLGCIGTGTIKMLLGAVVGLGLEPAGAALGLAVAVKPEGAEVALMF